MRMIKKKTPSINSISISISHTKKKKKIILIN